MKNYMLATITAITLTSACAHSNMRGSVAMKTAPGEAHVCLGNGEVAVGDKVAIFQNVCQGKTCTKTKVGEGQVTEILNDHYSVVKASGVSLEEGYIVERQ